MATELRFPVEIDDSQAAKELDKLVNKMDKLKENIAKNESARAPIVEQLKEAQDAAVEAYNRVEELKAALAESEAKTSITGNADPGTYIAEIQRQTQIKAELAEQEKIMQAKEKEAQKLEAQDSKILDVLAQQTAELEQAQERAGKLTEQITDATKGKNLKAIFEGTRAAVNSGVKSLLRYGIGIRTLFTLFSKLKTYTIEAVKAFAENDPDTQKSINELKASLQGLKGSWGAAFAPILNAVIPVLQTLVGWLTKAANAIAAFFAALSGRGSFKRAITDTGKLSDNLSSGAGAAKDMKKQLMGIDTLNVMSDNSDTGGGGGGSGSGLEYEDVQISDKLKNNLEAIKDIIVAIGAGIAGWGLGKVLTNLGLIKGGFKQLLGIALLVSGTVVAIKGGIDAWKNGIDWQNLIEMIGGVALAAGGAALEFGKTGAAITLLIGGIGMIVTAFHDWITTGELSTQTAALFAGGIIAIGLALTLLTGSWIPLVIAAILALGVAIVKWWDEISAWLDGVVGKVNSFFNNAIKTLSEKGTLITGVFILLYGSVQTIFNAIAGVIKTVLAIIRAVLITFAQVVRGFATGDWASSLEAIKSAWLDVWNSIKQTGANIINGIIGTVEAFVNNVIVMFNRLVSAVSSVMQFFGGGGISWRAGTVSIPRLAKGGIVDTATMFVAGEAGKEAVVPLERNTQWVTMVADGIVDRMTDKFAGLNMRMPAVAGGFVVPPNAFSPGGSYGGISPELESKIDALLDRLNGNNRPIEVRTTVELDKRKVGESIYTYTEERNRGRGK
jgi:hypothetical protein